MFKNLFKKKNEDSKDLVIKSPITGQYVAIEDIPDPVFAQKMMGEGFGIEPSEGVVVAPIDAEVVNVFPTKHAIGLKASNGIELLIHIGLETVAMNGEGFDVFVNAGDHVKVGDKLVEFDINLIKEKASSSISPVIITNSDLVDTFDVKETSSVNKGETDVVSVVLK